MTVVLAMIDLIGSDRPQWKPEERDRAVATWKRSFADVDSDVLMRAAESFLRNHAGKPDTHKLWKEIRLVQHEARNARALDAPSAWRQAPGDRERIDAELVEKGDPVADWLEARGFETMRQQQPKQVNDEDVPF